LVPRSAVPSGGVALFAFTRRGWALQGFVHERRGELRAWLNRCAHLPVTLDFGDGDLLNEAGDQFFCQSHGARYRTDTGLCIAGPCKGSSLHPLPLDETDGDVLRVDVSAVDSDRPPPPWYDDEVE
jgi:nitrite reductase/ring-hydroxylating ferredoxin subunit